MPVRLFVGNLPYDATEAELREHFSAVGSLSYVYFPTDRESGRLRGFAFVEFHDQAHADEAIRLLNNQPFKSRPQAVNEARARENGPGLQKNAPTQPFRLGGQFFGGDVDDADDNRSGEVRSDRVDDSNSEGNA